MLGHARRFRTRSSQLARLRVRPRPGLASEGLEIRRLLAASPINVAANLPLASGLPLPGLATGLGFTSSPATLTTSAVSVAPVSVSVAPGATAAGTISSATGPSTTLAQLMNDYETANAASSEVARPQPGRSDRISVILGTPEVVPILQLRSPTGVEVIPGPDLELFAPARLFPVEPPLEPIAPAPVPVPALPADPVPALAPLPEGQASAVLDPVPVAVWDAALELITAEIEQEGPTPLARPTQAALAAGAMLAAWTGWKSHSTNDGRSRRQTKAIQASTTQSTNGPGR